MKKFLVSVSPVFSVLMILWSWPLLESLFRYSSGLGALWILVGGFLLVGLYTGFRVYRNIEHQGFLRVFFSVSSGVAMTLLLPLIGLGGCCAVYML